METTDRRRLSRVPIEHLMVSPIGTMLLLLVSVSTDMEVMKGRGGRRLMTSKTWKRIIF